MKKIVFYAFAVLFVFTLGMAYAAEKPSKEINNGITVFGNETSGQSVQSMHAGGMREEGSAKEIYNGITVFGTENASIVKSAEGTNAGGMREEKPAREIYNGITVFGEK